MPALLLVLALLSPEVAQAVTVRQVLSCRVPFTARPTGRATRGTLRRAVQLSPRRGLHLRGKIRNRYDYGTDQLIAVLHHAADRMGAWPIVVGDLSLRKGGKFGRHKSHQNGLDVDLGLYQKGGRLQTFRRLTKRTFDADRNWRLVSALLSTGWVQWIFLDRDLHRPLRKAARKAGWGQGRIRSAFARIKHEPGHADHLHLRVKARSETCGRVRVARKGAPALRTPTLGVLSRRLALAARLERLGR